MRKTAPTDGESEIVAVSETPTNSDNLRHWNAFATTDPAHTKAFQRAGGFRGTSVEPIYNIQRMTEHFGPCGAGWWMSEPQFKLVPIEGNGELLVFCTLSIWYSDSEGTSSSVYGVGGDKVISKGRDGLRTSDEAFKSAYTDALGNAMKHLGMSADIYMGKFDDSKYTREAPPARRMPAETAPEHAGDDLRFAVAKAAGKGQTALQTFWKDLSNADRRRICMMWGSNPQLGAPAALKDAAIMADNGTVDADGVVA